MQALDHRIFIWINHWSERLAPLMRFFSEGMNQPWVKICLILVLLALIIAGRETRRAALQALLAAPLANEITDLFKHFIHFPRPCNDPALEQCLLRIGATDSWGTASAHSANMAAAATIFVIHLRGFGAPWVVLAIMVGLSRIYNGVHYPSQVLLGWIIGICAALCIHFVWQRVRKARQAKQVGNVASASEPKTATESNN